MRFERQVSLLLEDMVESTSRIDSLAASTNGSFSAVDCDLGILSLSQIRL